MNCFPLFRKSIQVSLSTIMIPLLFLLSFCMIVSTLHAASVSLTWNANTESDLAGYRIYLRTLPSTDYGSAVFSGLPSNPSSPQKTITNLAEGRSYGAIVTAYDNAGNESGPSNEGQFTTSSSSTTFPLTIKKEGNGSGTITSNPVGISCGSTCSTRFPENSSITLTAVAGSGSAFTGWSGGGCSGSNTSCTITLPWGKTVTATFEQSQTSTSTSPLTVKFEGTGSGRVSSSPSGLNCTSNCSIRFPKNSSITLSAVASAGSTFSGWSGGGCSGTNTSCTVYLNFGKTVKANFQSSQTSGTPRIVTPTPGTSISGGSTTFTWEPKGTAVTEWWLYVGTSQGAKDILTSGSIPSSTRSRTVSGLPTNGSSVWVKLWWRTASTDWQNTDFQYSTRR